MRFNRLFLCLLPVWIAALSGEARAQLAPGQSCLLTERVTGHAKPRGKGKKITLEAGTEVVLDKVRGKNVKVIARSVTVWLKRGKLRKKCAPAKAMEEPVFDAGTGLAEEPAPVAAAPVEPKEEPRAEPLIEEEATEPVDEEPGSEEGAGLEERPWQYASLGALGGLGAGHQGDVTRLTFDIALDLTWPLTPAFAISGRLFLHGTPGAGYGFGGLTVEARLYVADLNGIEVYLQAGGGGGYGAAGETTPVCVARAGGGGRVFVSETVFLNAELNAVISQLSVAGHLDVGAGLTF